MEEKLIHQEPCPPEDRLNYILPSCFSPCKRIVQVTDRWCFLIIQEEGLRVKRYYGEVREGRQRGRHIKRPRHSPSLDTLRHSTLSVTRHSPSLDTLRHSTLSVTRHSPSLDTLRHSTLSVTRHSPSLDTLPHST